MAHLQNWIKTNGKSLLLFILENSNSYKSRETGKLLFASCCVSEALWQGSSGVCLNLQAACSLLPHTHVRIYMHMHSWQGCPCVQMLLTKLCWEGHYCGAGNLGKKATKCLINPEIKMLSGWKTSKYLILGSQVPMTSLNTRPSFKSLSFL